MITLMSIIIYSSGYLPVEAHYQCGDKLNYSDRCSHLDPSVTPSLHEIADSQLLVMTIMPAPAGTTGQCGDQVRSPLHLSRHPHVAACCSVLTITAVSPGYLLIIFIKYQKHQVKYVSYRASSGSYCLSNK